MYTQFFKRLFDSLFAFVGLVVMIPIMLICIIILCFVNKGRPFYTQARPGKNEKVFNVFKLKTMNDNKDASGNLLPDSDRITKFGTFLRKSSLDEIPQLLNVLKGDMSLIGPRPLLIRYGPYYSEIERKRFSVRPGITGLAQISGRNFIDWDKKLEKDVEYVENFSFALDVKIFFQTIIKVLKSEGVEVNQDTNPDTVALDILRKDWVLNK